MPCWCTMVHHSVPYYHGTVGVHIPAHPEIQSIWMVAGRVRCIICHYTNQHSTLHQHTIKSFPKIPKIVLVFLVFSAFPRPVGDQVFPPCPLHPLHIVPTSDGGTMVAMVPHTPSPWHIWIMSIGLMELWTMSLIRS